MGNFERLSVLVIVVIIVMIVVIALVHVTEATTSRRRGGTTPTSTRRTPRRAGDDGTRSDRRSRAGRTRARRAAPGVRPADATPAATSGPPTVADLMGSRDDTRGGRRTRRSPRRS